RLRDGLHAVIVGPPNAGKSSLLNALSGRDRAIVTDIAGTTRDLLHEQVHIDGVELTLVDTAGLRDGGDAIEREGMRRARAELERADLALVVLDAREPARGLDALGDALAGVPLQLVVHNKMDLVDPGQSTASDSADIEGRSEFRVSARTGEGLPALRAALARMVTGEDAGGGEFTARARHVEALREAQGHLGDARGWLHNGQLELAAEALRLAHDALGG